MNRPVMNAAPKPFDAATKQLVELRPGDWPVFLGLPGRRARTIRADLASVTTEADQVLRVEDDPPYLIHLEFQSGDSSGIGERLLRYNVLLHYRHALPVCSVVLLLRREADRPDVTGTLYYERVDGSRYLSFEYGVVRVWEQSTNDLLGSGLGTLPLAPLADASRSDLRDVVRRMEERIRAEAASPTEAATLWTSTYLLMGLRYPAALIGNVLQGVRNMKESTTYQAILAEGRVEGKAEGKVEGKAEEARALLLRLGRKRFGPPSAPTEAALAAITSVERLEALAEKLLEAESWAELIG